jgi:adenylate cyclase
VAPVATWLIDGSRGLSDEQLVEQLGARLIEAGIPVWRLSTSILTKHPEVLLLNIEWTCGHSSTLQPRRHELLGAPMYLGSPAAAIRAGEDLVRCRRGDAGVTRFALVGELFAAGATDYVAMSLLFGDGQRTFISCATDAEGGFSDDDIEALRSLRPEAAIRLELSAERHVMRSLLTVYLGQNAAARVYSGAFRRGTGETLPCAILFSDMRGFTDFADRRAPAEVVATLDRFFEAVAGPLHEEGGEILKFIGDAVLAIFRVGDESPPSEVCQRALRAGERALAAIDALNAASEGSLRLGLALHFGEVMYGNIGAQNRLDFTVIGAAVNEASRLEGLCKVVQRPLLASAAFVEALGSSEASRLESVGAHTLKGVGRPVEVFGLRAPR